MAKRANLERIKEFSKNLQSFNRQTLSQQPKLPPAAEKRDIAISEQKFNRWVMLVGQIVLHYNAQLVPFHHVVSSYQPLTRNLRISSWYQPFSRRQKAIEFAKNVPKPRVPSQQTSQPQQQQGRGGRAAAGCNGDGDYDESDYYATHNNNAQGGGMDMGAEYAHESRIMELEAQHTNRKIQIEAMKKNLGLKWCDLDVFLVRFLRVCILLEYMKLRIGWSLFPLGKLHAIAKAAVNCNSNLYIQSWRFVIIDAVHTVAPAFLVPNSLKPKW